MAIGPREISGELNRSAGPFGDLFKFVKHRGVFYDAAATNSRKRSIQQMFQVELVQRRIRNVCIGSVVEKSESSSICMSIADVTCVRFPPIYSLKKHAFSSPLRSMDL